MAPRKFPPDELQVRTTFSLPRADWDRVQFISIQRGPRTSASAIVREAVAEYLARRFGPAGTTEQVAV